MSDSRESSKSSPWYPLLARVIVVITVAAIVPPFTAGSETAVVVRVVDGDTVELADGRFVRLQGIDAPEITQPYGAESKQWLEIAVLRRPVRLQSVKRAAYGRTEAQLIWERTDVNGYQVHVGAAWVDARYTHRPIWLKHQRVAKQKRRGLWGAVSPIAPWDWRVGRRLPSVMATPRVIQSAPVYVIPQTYCPPGGT